jgi:hypothetical protein
VGPGNDEPKVRASHPAHHRAGGYPAGEPQKEHAQPLLQRPVVGDRDPAAAPRAGDLVPEPAGLCPLHQLQRLRLDPQV